MATSFARFQAQTISTVPQIYLAQQNTAGALFIEFLYLG